MTAATADTRFKILQIAAQYADDRENTVARAQAYLDFVYPPTQEEAEETAPLASVETAEPGVARRKRRTKAEIEADNAKDAALLLEPEPAQPKTDYSHVKAAVVTVISKKGSKPVIEALEEFGVGTALELQPSQYDEFIKTLGAKLAG